MEIMTERLKLIDIIDNIKGLEDTEFVLDKAEFIRKSYTPEEKEVKEDERAIISYISTISIDRDGEVVLPKGGDLTDYKKNPVVLALHNYRSLPIGKNQWIKRDKKGLIGKTIYARHEEADKFYNYRKDGFPLAESIGFIPLEYVSKNNDSKEEWEKVLGEWKDAYKEIFGKKPKEEPHTIYTKWILLEYSDVPVPSNPEALQLAVSKGLVINKNNSDKQPVIEKPYENEHSCDLGKGPYDKYNRVNCDQKHDGKCIDVVYGIKDGKSEISSLRYKTDTWTESAAKSHCKSRDGRFVAASKDVQIEETQKPVQDNTLLDDVEIVFEPDEELVKEINLEDIEITEKTYTEKELNEKIESAIKSTTIAIHNKWQKYTKDIVTCLKDIFNEKKGKVI